MVSLKDHLKSFLRQEAKLLPLSPKLASEVLSLHRGVRTPFLSEKTEPPRSAVEGLSGVKAELSLRLLTIPITQPTSVSSRVPVTGWPGILNPTCRWKNPNAGRGERGKEVSNLLKVLISWLPELPKPPTIAGVWEYQGFHNEAVPVSHDSRKDLRGFTSWYNPHPLRRRSYG